MKISYLDKNHHDLYMDNSIKVMLVDDHQMIIDSLHLLFNLIEGVEVVGTEHDSRNVIGILEKQAIDVLITDYRMPHLDGLQLTRMVKEKHPEIKVLLLSVNEDAKDIQNAFHAGASGYVLKKASRKVLEEAVKDVAMGKMYYGQDAMKAMLSKNTDKELTDSSIQTKLSSLTKRELEIIRLLVDENSSTEIGEQLNISSGTVETHRHNILRKLDAKSTIGVIKFAMKAGLA